MCAPHGDLPESLEVGTVAQPLSAWGETVWKCKLSPLPVEASALAKVADHSGHPGRISSRYKRKHGPDHFYLPFWSENELYVCLRELAHALRRRSPRVAQHNSSTAARGGNSAACDSTLFHGTTDCHCRLRLITSPQLRHLETKH